MRTRRRSHGLWAAALGALFAGACGGNGITKELVDARRTYDAARTTQAPALVPAEMLEAEEALQRAEQIHQKDPGSDAERHYAYLAQRRAELAIIEADRAAANAERQKAEEEYARLQRQERERARRALDDTRAELQRTRGELANVKQESERREELEAKAEALAERKAELEGTLAETTEELEAERQRRIQAEERAAAAMESLSEIAEVQRTEDETIITLSGQVLFPVGDSTLSATARQRLSRVADALKAQADDKAIVVEGHTDSQGNAAMNEGLSLARANSVREYLVSQGVPPERIQAVGKGESEPIADNSRPDGRAANRRVEIILKNR